MNFTTIIAEGQQTSFLYKLTQGKCVCLDEKQNVVTQLTAPTYLNLIQNVYKVPSLKHIAAQGKYIVQKIKYRPIKHLAQINSLKQKGIKKSLFALFEPFHCNMFYELALRGISNILRRGQKMKLFSNKIYLLAKGKVTIQQDGYLKSVSLAAGQVISCCEFGVISQAQGTILHSIDLQYAKYILGEQYQQIQKLHSSQQNTFKYFLKNNKSVSRMFKNANSNNQSINSIQTHYVNIHSLKNTNNVNSHVNSPIQMKFGLQKKHKRIMNFSISDFSLKSKNQFSCQSFENETNSKSFVQNKQKRNQTKGQNFDFSIQKHNDRERQLSLFQKYSIRKYCSHNIKRLKKDSLLLKNTQTRPQFKSFYRQR